MKRIPAIFMILIGVLPVMLFLTIAIVGIQKVWPIVLPLFAVASWGALVTTLRRDSAPKEELGAWTVTLFVWLFYFYVLRDARFDEELVTHSWIEFTGLFVSAIMTITSFMQFRRESNKSNQPLQRTATSRRL